MAARTFPMRTLLGAIALGSVAVLGACVTTYEELPLFGQPAKPPAYATAMTIPFGVGAPDPADGVVSDFYRSVLQRMHEAAKDNDIAGLEALLANYERPGMPSPVQQRVAGYRAVARGLNFRQHLRAHARLVPVAPPEGSPAQQEAGAPALGAPLHYELQVPAGSDVVTLGAKDSDDPIGFVVSVSVEDAFVEGGSRSLRKQDFLWLPEPFALRGDAVLRLPLAVDFPGEGAVKREVLVRIDLMPGYVLHEGGRSPVPRTTIAAATTTQFPVGYAAVAAAPLAELQRALQQFDPKTFARAFLAAYATSGDDRDKAIGLLIEQVRFGRADQAQVAMAALRAITQTNVVVGDRDGWLAWWQNRR